jgi:hypothetical protein
MMSLLPLPPPLRAFVDPSPVGPRVRAQPVSRSRASRRSITLGQSVVRLVSSVRMALGNGSPRGTGYPCEPGRE